MLEFRKTQEFESLFATTPHGTCPVCGVAVSSGLPLMTLWDEEDVVFKGCAGCLEERAACSREGRALMRVVLLLCRQRLLGAERGIA